MNGNLTFADNVVVAHRGAWKAKNLPENSIAALKEAIALGCAGSEFDVHMTADSVLVVNHDADYHGMKIEELSYASLNQKKLSNGEDLPTLKAYILAGMENNSTTGLVCELKPASSKERGTAIAKKTLELVDELNAADYVSSYISFDYNILESLLAIDPKLHTQFLSGKKPPAELKADGIAGLDYHLNVFKRNPSWITEAKELGLTLNAWTVNKKNDLIFLLNNEFDYITTNEPELLFSIIEERKKNSWDLVWQDEFDYEGKPDSTKWNYELGMVRNNEAQYYTDSLKNAFVENGYLHLVAHKEKHVNEKYKSESLKDKSWMKWAYDKDSADYTSASLTTNGLHEWQYGKIEVSAKLPKGRGTWPAIWMLGKNRPEVGWPECGEIDIMEHVGYDPDTIHGTVHTGAYNHIKGTQVGKAVPIKNPYTEFHTYAIIWTPEKIEFLLDNEVYHEFKNDNKTTAEWPFDQPFYLKLNVAIGGGWGGRKGIDNSIFPQEMVVDYVRVYQASPQASPKGEGTDKN